MQEWNTGSENETRELAGRLAESLAPDAACLLVGGMGSGKTVFAQGLAAAGPQPY